MGSAASAVSTDSANALNLLTQSDRNGTDATSIAPQQMKLTYDLYSPKPGSNHPGTAHSSHSQAPTERRSLAPSRRSNLSHASHRTQMSRHMSVEELLEDPVNEDMSSDGLPSPTPSISDEQKAMVQGCLSSIERGLTNSGVQLNVDRVLPFVEVITILEEDGEDILKSSGMYIVQHGMLDMCAGDGHTVTQRLGPGDYFGELSTLFRVPSNRDIQAVSREVTLLHMPTDAVRECVRVKEGSPGFNKEVMLNWCVRKSYLGSSELFGPKVLSRGVVLSCLKKSVLSDLSLGAMEFIANLATPMLFDAGDIIYSTGEEANYIYLILKGSVEELKGENVLRSKTVKYSDEGFCLGHLEFFSGMKLRYGARASSPLILTSVSKEILIEMLNMFPQEIEVLKKLLTTFKTSK